MSTQATIQWMPGVKRPGRGVNHSSPSGAKAKNEWSYTSTPPVCLYGVGREKLTFLPSRRLLDSVLN